MIDGKCKPIVMFPPRDFQISTLNNTINKDSLTTDTFLPGKVGRWYQYTPITNKVDRMFLKKKDVDKLKDLNIITEDMMNLVIHLYNR